MFAAPISAAAVLDFGAAVVRDVHHRAEHIMDMSDGVDIPLSSVPSFCRNSNIRGTPRVVDMGSNDNFQFIFIYWFTIPYIHNNCCLIGVYILASHVPVQITTPVRDASASSAVPRRPRRTSGFIFNCRTCKSLI